MVGHLVESLRQVKADEYYTWLAVDEYYTWMAVDEYYTSKDT